MSSHFSKTNPPPSGSREAVHQNASISEVAAMAEHREAYLAYLGLKRNPFPVAPDAETFFLPARVDALIAEILHSIHTRKGFMVVTGEVGLGKTTISHRLMRILDEGKVNTALVFNTFLQGADLLEEINRDFGIDVEKGLDSRSHLAALNAFLIEQYHQGRNCAIVLDDAQNLTQESLELVRMISNLETNAEKLVQILMVGQTELAEKLDAHELRQLKSRIVVYGVMHPYDLDELKQYVFFRLNASGGVGNITIPDDTFKAVHQLTSGNPRLINKLMDRSLYALFAYNTQKLTRKLVVEVAAEVALVMPKRSWKPLALKLGLSAVGIGALGALAAFLWFKMPPSSATDEPSATPVVQKVQPAPSATDQAQQPVKRDAAEEALLKTQMDRSTATQEMARKQVAQAQMAESKAMLTAAKARRESARQKMIAAKARQESQQHRSALRSEKQARVNAESDAERARLDVAKAMAAFETSRLEAEQAALLAEKSQRAANRQAEAVARAKRRTDEAELAMAEARMATEKARSDLTSAKTDADKAKAQAQQVQAEMEQKSRALAQEKAAREQAEAEAAKTRALLEQARAETKARATALEQANAARRHAEAEAAQAKAEAEQMRRKSREVLEKAEASALLARRQVQQVKSESQKAKEVWSSLNDREKRHLKSELEALRKTTNSAVIQAKLELKEAKEVRLRAETQAQQARLEIERKLAQAQLAQKKAEQQAEEARQKSQQVLDELRAERKREEQEAQRIRDEASRMMAEAKVLQAQAQKAMQEAETVSQTRSLELDLSPVSVDETPIADQSSASSSAGVDLVDPFLSAYGLQAYQTEFSRGLSENWLDPVVGRIARERGYRLVRLRTLPQGVARHYTLLPIKRPDGTVREYLFFWKPSHWIGPFHYGKVGPEILHLQKQLAALGLYHSNLDGNVGRLSLKGVMSFQKTHGLPRTGIPDAATQFLLAHETAGKLAGTPKKPARRTVLKSRTVIPPAKIQQDRPGADIDTLQVADERLTARLNGGVPPVMGVDWVAQLASFKTQHRVDVWMAKMHELGIPAYVTRTTSLKRGRWFLVWGGPWNSYESAQQEVDRIKKTLRIRDQIFINKRTPKGRSGG
ncbi:MAG: AAA family ATPase [Magnetococcales bacterium]|nr:AAA family ATPase [Magnetococcales bacterium]